MAQRFFQMSFSSNLLKIRTFTQNLQQIATLFKDLFISYHLKWIDLIKDSVFCARKLLTTLQSTFEFGLSELFTQERISLNVLMFSIPWTFDYSFEMYNKVYVYVMKAQKKQKCMENFEPQWITISQKEAR